MLKGLIKTLLKGLIKKKKVNDEASVRELLNLDMAEIEKASDRLFNRLDDRIKALKTIEARVDKKIANLERLLTRAENITAGSKESTESRQIEISRLSQKGLKIDEIASILDMPKGEVELILNIKK